MKIGFRSLLSIFAFALADDSAFEGSAATTDTEIFETIYATEFKGDEDYDPEFTLAGQNGWQIYGTGGNGLVDSSEEENFFAYLGFDAPTDDTYLTTLYLPVEVTSVLAHAPTVSFWVSFELVESENGNHDIFGWSFYNASENLSHLFSIMFDLRDKSINYQLGDSDVNVSTGYQIATKTLYDLSVDMNFQLNTWRAMIGETVIVNNQPIAGDGIELSLGSVDALWLVNDGEKPGDNYMLFDNYSITRTGPARSELVIRLQGILPDNRTALRIYAEPGATYQVYASINLTDWVLIKTTTTSQGEYSFDIIDDNAPQIPARFYQVVRAD